MNLTVTINMSKRCAECGKFGAADSGICLKCCMKAMDQHREMKSAQGKIVQARYAKILRDAKQK